MRILVTGNQGYVGPVLGRHLRDTWPDATLIGFDAGFFAAMLTAPDGVSPEHSFDRQVFGDVRDLDPRLLRGVDAVVHLAAVSNDPMGSRFEAVTAQINAAASVALARAARAAGVRSFVFASSCSVYGFAPGDARTEDDPLNPQTAYARSKVDTEAALASIGGDAMAITCLRFATACGMSDRLRLDLVLNDFVASALATGEVTVMSDGTPWRPLIDVRDMARAIAWACARDPGTDTPFLAVNVGTAAANVRVIEIAGEVCAAIPGARVRVNPAAPPDTRSYRVDFARFAALAPRHQPRVTLSRSVAMERDGLTALGFADADFRQSRLMRLRMLEHHIAAGRLDDRLRWTARAFPEWAA